MHEKQLPACRVLLISKDKKWLVMYVDGLWDFPGGLPEEHEIDFKSAIERIVFEQTGLEVHADIDRDQPISYYQGRSAFTVGGEVIWGDPDRVDLVWKTIEEMKSLRRQRLLHPAPDLQVDLFIWMTYDANSGG